MKSLMFFLILGAIFTIQLEAQNPIFYKLKVYTFDNEEQAKRTDEFLKSTYLPAVKRQRIKDVGVFKNRISEKDSSIKTYVLIPSVSVNSLLNLDDGLMKDGAYLASGSAYFKAKHDNPPYARIENIYLKAFEDMPFLKPSPLTGARMDRIYELRSYESATEVIYKNKVDMFNAGGEIILFDKLGFNAVFYAEVIAGGKMPNLMYMTTHADQNARDKNWEAFSAAPKWKEIKSMPKYQNNVSHIDIYFLYPTEYSDY